MNKVIWGDALQALKSLPDSIVQTCVTSPPYFGLRDYGVDGQIGLEETPEAFTQKLVAVFKEVRRVIKDDGTLWLNLGDSYAGSGKGGQSEEMRSENWQPEYRNKGRKYGLKPKDLIGIPWRVAFALQQPFVRHVIKTEGDRAYIAGLVDGEGCITILKTKSAHGESYSYPPIVQIRMCDTEAVDHFASLMGVNRSEAELYQSSKNAGQRPSYTVKVTAQKAMDLIADIYPYLRVKRKQAVVAYNHQLLRGKTNYQPRSKDQLAKEELCKTLINKLNQREPVDLPSWMIEPTPITEPGWYLRQDLIWAKPNPMPESVTDRCTKAHEYIFLLSKSPRYYFDNEAIKEPVKHDWGTRDRSKGKYTSDRNKTGLNNHGGLEKSYTTANKRSVWTVTTKPYKGAHFATFPPDLIEPCVLAGSRPNDIVFDPFAGSGTTLAVAKQNGRQYLGIELNPSYLDLINERLGNTPSSLPFLQAAE